MGPGQAVAQDEIGQPEMRLQDRGLTRPLAAQGVERSGPGRWSEIAR